jgi:hypothetical protein
MLPAPGFGLTFAPDAARGRTAMAKGWKCPHCSTQNPETTLTCSGCGRIQGSVVVPGSTPPQPVSPGTNEPSEGWQASSSDWSPGPGTAPGNSLDNTLGAPANSRADTGADAPPSTPSWAVNVDALPPAPTPLWRRLPIGGIIVVVVVIAVGIGGFIFSASRSATGEIDRSGDMTANDLRVGDCFDLKEPDAEEVSDVTAHPCTEAHEYEVFYIGAVAEGAYPGLDALTEFVIDNCEPAFGGYVGTAYLDSQLDFSWLYPSDDSWGDGDRSVQCAVYDPANARLTASLKGSAQ